MKWTLTFCPVGNIFLKNVSKLSGKARRVWLHPGTSSSTVLGALPVNPTGVRVEILESGRLFVLKGKEEDCRCICTDKSWCGVKLRPWHLFLSTIMLKRGCSLLRKRHSEAWKLLCLRHSWCFQKVQNNAFTVLSHHIQKSTQKLPPTESRASSWLCASLSAHKPLWCVSAEPPDAQQTG